jgi:hypothetical protein
LKLTAGRIRQLLEAVNQELAGDGVRGELFLAGGDVMRLVFHTREASEDAAQAAAIMVEE